MSQPVTVRLPHGRLKYTNWNGRGVRPKFTAAEDFKLSELVSRYGVHQWATIARKFRNKTTKQCRERWQNYVNPSLRLGEWDESEDLLLVEKYNEIGPKWTNLTQFFTGRSVNNVRNRWLKLNRAKKYVFVEFPSENNEQTDSNDNTEQIEEKEPPKTAQESDKKIPQLISHPDVFKELEASFDNFEAIFGTDQGSDQSINPLCFTNSIKYKL